MLRHLLLSSLLLLLLLSLLPHRHIHRTINPINSLLIPYRLIIKTLVPHFNHGLFLNLLSHCIAPLCELAKLVAISKESRNP